MPKDQQHEWIKASLRPKNRLHIFGRYFFPDVIQGNEAVPEAHHALIDEMSAPRHSAIIFPRGHAKSTWMKIDTLHDIIYELEPLIQYCSDTLDDAMQHFGAIKAQLESNGILRQIYGNLVPDVQRNQSAKWSDKHFRTTNGIICIARGSGKGRGVNIMNQRPTKIIIDDGETDEMVRSKQRRHQYRDWVMNVIIPSLAPDGKLKVVGTVIHPHAFVLWFYENFGGIFRRAIEGGKSIWPWRFPLAELKKLRDGYITSTGKRIAGIGVRAFSQEYLNKPINDDTNIFRREWLEDNTWTKMPTEDELKQFFTIKMVVDPNAGLSEMADFMGIVVMGKDKRTNLKWVFYAEHFKLPIKLKDLSKPSSVKKIDEVYTMFDPVVLGVECVMNQTAMYQILAGENKYRLKKLTPQSKDKVERSKKTESHVAQGHILFHPDHVDLYDEMIEFPNGEHDDLVDALIYCDSLFATNTVKLKQNKSPMHTARLMKQKF